MSEIKKYIKSEKEKELMNKETAARFDEGKIRYELIPSYALEQLAKVYTYGAQKYDDDNWRKGLNWLKTIGSLLRHVYAWKKGETLDPESNCHHLAMASWNCFSLMSYEKHSVGIDDRHPQDLELMDKKERNKRFYIRNKLIKENRIDQYNGLTIEKELENE